MPVAGNGADMRGVPIDPGPVHGDNGNATAGAIGGILLLVVLLVFAIWTARTWWKNNH